MERLCHDMGATVATSSAVSLRSVAAAWPRSARVLEWPGRGPAGECTEPLGAPVYYDSGASYMIATSEQFAARLDA
jgi:hypothetical protein